MTHHQTCHACGGPFAHDELVVRADQLDVLEAVAALRGRAEATLALQKMSRAGALVLVAERATSITVQGSRIQNGSLVVVSTHDDPRPFRVIVQNNHVTGGGITLGQISDSQVVNNVVIGGP